MEKDAHGDEATDEVARKLRLLFPRHAAMIGRLFALFLLVPIVELYLLLAIGQRVGFWPTLGLIVVTAVLGSYLAKREGFGVWQRAQAKLAQGTLPSDEVLDGLIVLVSAALLLTPGVLTDLVGVLGLLPHTRALVRKALHQRLQHRLVVHQPAGGFMWTSGGAAPFPRPSATKPPDNEDGTGAVEA